MDMHHALHAPLSAAIFDLDGTLLATESLMLPSWIEAFAESGIIISHQQAAVALGQGSHRARQALRDRLGLALDYVAIQRRCKQLFQEQAAREALPCRPGAKRILETLHSHGIPIGLATSSPQATALAQLKMAALLPYFSATAFGDEVDTRKPAPDIYQLCLKRLSISPRHNALAIEDSANGIQAAHAAGIPVACIPHLDAIPEPVQRLTAGTFTNLDTLTDSLFQRSNAPSRFRPAIHAA